MDKYITLDYWMWLLGFACSGIFNFILPVGAFLLITTALVIGDLVSGTMAAKKRNEKIHSKGLRRTVEKLFVYYGVILLAQGLVKAFDIPSINISSMQIDVTYVVAFTIAISEFKSIAENVEDITGVNIWGRVWAFLSPLIPSKFKQPEEASDEKNK